ncbi:MAG: hypothetical protein OXG30_15975 [bacterium]|nr:hypothetical protein [bacterium]
MDSSNTAWGSIRSFAVRTAHLLECVSEAHSLGHGPGRFRKPWRIEFQRKARTVYAESLSSGYLRGVADASRHCAGLMDNTAPGEELTDDWKIFAEFLRTTGEALHEVPQVASVASTTGIEQISSVPPAVLRYELFAELLHPAGVDRLRRAVDAVARGCELYLDGVPTSIEIEWIISVAFQEPISELANRNQTSVRGMYRLLEALWARLGVRNQIQGVALAVQQGWITPSKFFGEEH